MTQRRNRGKSKEQVEQVKTEPDVMGIFVGFRRTQEGFRPVMPQLIGSPPPDATQVAWLKDFLVTYCENGMYDVYEALASQAKSQSLLAAQGGKKSSKSTGDDANASAGDNLPQPIKDEADDEEKNK